MATGWVHPHTCCISQGMRDEGGSYTACGSGTRENSHGQGLNQNAAASCSPLLDASIVKAILSCGHCKNFGNTHLHPLLTPIIRRRPFELLAGDYLSMLVGKGGYSKIGLYIDVFTRRLYAYKYKSATGRSTVDSL
jgi:hypothetical protein